MAMVKRESLTAPNGHVSESPAERWFRQEVEGCFDDEWVAIQSTPLLRHVSKARGEIDFILVGPPGLFVVEVKGGGVTRHGYRAWEYSGSPGKIERQGPWEQADGNYRSLRDLLRDLNLGIGAILLGYGVCLPDSRFRAEFGAQKAAETDVNLATLFDLDDRRSGRTLADYVGDLDTYWRAKISRKVHARLSTAQRESLVRALWPEPYEAPAALASESLDINVRLQRLTEEQAKILRSYRNNPRVIVEGGAGTGKTALAALEAERLASTLAGAPLPVLFTCFNKNLAADVSQRLNQVAPTVRVRHFHGVLEDAIRAAGLGKELDQAAAELGPGSQAAKPFLEQWFPELGMRALGKLGRQAAALVIDEGQDLLSADFVLALDALLDGGLERGTWRLLLDRNQDLFSRFDVQGLALFEAPSPSYAELETNCRNTEQIASKTELLSGVSWTRLRGVEGRPVAIELWTSGEQQAALVLKKITYLLQEGFSPEAIVVLSPWKRANCEGMRALDAAGESPLPIIDLGEEGETEDVIRFSTVSGFKGLDSDAVILMGVRDIQDTWQRSQLYVGMSRARSFLSVLIKDDSPGRNRNRLDALDCEYRAGGR